MSIQKQTWDELKSPHRKMSLQTLLSYELGIKGAIRSQLSASEGRICALSLVTGTRVFEAWFILVCTPSSFYRPGSLSGPSPPCPH